ncbi:MULTISPECIES: hypothetical protein [unclassified Rhizobium]|uniref:hypothetical protein n=1 Tax=unclassified Rhizobium TaxID=2613769 RepID=UPI001FDFC703|nr:MULTISPECIES: hypothetical protein [unclassified Rhizobium]
MMASGGTVFGGFRCEALVGSVPSPEARACLEALVRTYGELLAIYSFMHMALKEKSMRLLIGELADRAKEIKRSVRYSLAGSRGLAGQDHALSHLGRADRLLAEAEEHLQRGVLVSDAPLLGLLSNAARELRRSAAILGTTTFDTTACCGGSLLGHGEEDHGSAFDLGA